jgi:selenocysteine lyase/cysteine desulfurase
VTEYDVAKVRTHFPALESGLVFFDGPGGSQTPDAVGEAVSPDRCRTGAT